MTVGGVPFTIADYPGGGTGAIQTDAASPQVPSTFDIAVSIPISNPDAGTVYTLINSAFGQFGYLDGSVEFVGTGGADVVFDLTQGDNIRDHNNGFYNNVIAPGTPSAEFGGGSVRLDRQTFVLPPSFFGQTLTDIIFSGFGDVPTGQPFLAAVTVGSLVSAAPEASTLTAIGLSGLALFGARKWRKRRIAPRA